MFCYYTELQFDEQISGGFQVPVVSHLNDNSELAAQFIRASTQFAQLANSVQHISNKRPHCVTICSRPFTSPLLPRPPFPFLLPSFTPLLPLWLSLPVSPRPLTFPLPPFYPPAQPSPSCRFVVLLSSSSAPLHSSLPLSPSFHFGFSDSGNEMFHYLHFTAFNRERIQAKPRVVSQGVTMGEMAGLGAQRERQPRNYTHIRIRMHKCKGGRPQKDRRLSGWRQLG